MIVVEEARKDLGLLLGDSHKILEELIFLDKERESPSNGFLFDEMVQKASDLEKSLSEPFLLALIGVFSSGKSYFINSILGEEILKTGVSPTNATITYLMYGEQKEGIVHWKDGKTKKVQPFDEIWKYIDRRKSNDEEIFEKIDRVELRLPIEFLKDLNIVDTPGLNAVFQYHEKRTKEFLHKAHAVIWLFYAKKIEAEVNKESLETLKGYRKKIIGIVNAIDEAEDKKGQLDNAIKHFGEYFVQDSGKPVVFPYSSKLALEARTENNIEKLRESGFGPLYSYLTDNFFTNEGGLQRDKLLSIRDTLKAILEKSRASLQNEIGILLEKVDEYKEKASEKEKQIEEITYVVEEGVNDEIKDIIEIRTGGLIERLKAAVDAFIDDKMQLGVIKEMSRFFFKRDELKRQLQKEFREKYFSKADEKVFADDLGNEVARLLKREWRRIANKISVELVPLNGLELDAVVDKAIKAIVKELAIIGVLVIIVILIPGFIDDIIIAIGYTLMRLIKGDPIERKRPEAKRKALAQLSAIQNTLIFRFKQVFFRQNHEIVEEIVSEVRKELGIIESNYFKYNVKTKALNIKNNRVAELIHNAEVFEI